MSPTGAIGPQGAYGAGQKPPKTGPVGFQGFVGPTGEAAKGSTPGFTADKLSQAIQAAPPLQHHPDLAYAAASVGGDITQNAHSIMGMKTLNEIINGALEHAGFVFNNKVQSVTRISEAGVPYRITSDKTGPVSYPSGKALTQGPQGQWATNLDVYRGNRDVIIQNPYLSDQEKRIALRLVDKDWQSKTQPVPDAATQDVEMQSPTYQEAAGIAARTGISVADAEKSIQEADAAKTQRAQQLYEALKQSNTYEGLSIRLAEQGVPMTETMNRTYAQTIQQLVAETTDQRMSQLPEGWDKPEPPPEDTSWRAAAVKEAKIFGGILHFGLTALSMAGDPLSPKDLKTEQATDRAISQRGSTANKVINEGVKILADAIFHDQDPTHRTYLEAWGRRAVAFTVNGVVDMFKGANAEANRTVANQSAALQGQQIPYASSGTGLNPAAIGLAGATAMFGAQNPAEFFVNTQRQYKYLHWVYKNQGERGLADAIAPIVMGALIGSAGGGALRALRAGRELEAISAGRGLTEAERALRDSGEIPELPAPRDVPSLHNYPRRDRPNDSQLPLAPIATAREVRDATDAAAEALQRTQHVEISGTVASRVAEAMNQALSDVWNQIDKGVWAGLKMRGDLPTDLEFMLRTSDVALTERLRVVAEEMNLTPEELDVVTRASRRVMNEKINEFHDIGLSNRRAGRTYRGAAAVGEGVVWAASQTARGIRKVTESRPWTMTQDAWAGAQAFSFMVNPREHPDWWAAAQAEQTLSIGQEIFGAGSIMSGLTDAFVAMTSGPVPVGHLFAGAGRAAGVTNLTAETIDRAWRGGGFFNKFRRALTRIEGMTPGEAAQVFRELQLPADAEGNSIASRLAIRGEDGELRMGTAQETYERMRNLTVAGQYASQFKLPTIGLYGSLRAARVDGNQFVRHFSNLFGRSPFALTDAGELISHAVHYGDPMAPAMIGDALRQAGKPQAEVNAVVDMMLANPLDHEMWKNVAQQAIAEVFSAALSRSVGEMLGQGAINLTTLMTRLGVTRAELRRLERGEIELTNEQQQALRTWLDETEAMLEPHREYLNQLNQVIDGAAAKLVGSPGATEFGTYGLRHSGGAESAIDISRLRNGRMAALSPRQAGMLYIPSYKDIHKVMRDDIVRWIKDQHGHIDTAGGVMTRNLSVFSSWVNNVINNNFFKPLALATGGWAIRVSLSEAALNTARFGPRNMIAGYASQNLIQQQRVAYRRIGEKVWGETDPERVAYRIRGHNKVSRGISGAKNAALDNAVAREISLVVRGLLSSVDEVMLAGVGKSEFAQAAIDLMWRHDGYLPHGTGAVHTAPAGHIQLTEWDKMIQRDSRRRRVKRIATTGKYRRASFGSDGYFTGWSDMAHWIANDDVVYRRVAQVYRDLREENLTAEELRLRATDEAERILRQHADTRLAHMDRSASAHVDSQSEDPVRAWAEGLVHNLEYTVHGYRGVIGAAGEVGRDAAFLNEPLLNDIADANIPSDLHEFIERYATDENGRIRPASHLPFDTVSPEPDFFNWSRGQSFIARLAASGHQKLLGPIVNHMIRQPLYIVNYVTAMRDLEPMIGSRIITREQAEVMAEIRAAKNMLPFIHNPSDKIKFEEMLATGFPFYFAQNQAWRRVGRLFAEDPGKFFQYMIAMNAVANTVNEITKNTGMGVYAVPLSLWLLGVPLTASFTSLAVIDPFAAGGEEAASSPLTKGMEFFAPHAGWVASTAGHLAFIDIPQWFGGMMGLSEEDKHNLHNIAENQMISGKIAASQSIVDAMIPNTILKSFKQYLVARTGGDPDTMIAANDNAWSSGQYIQAYIEARASLMYDEIGKQIKKLKKQGMEGEMLRYNLAIWQAEQFNPEIAGNRYQWLHDRAVNMAQTTLLAKAFLSAASPLTLGVGDTNPEVTQLRNTLASDPKLGFQGAINKLYLEHPEYSPEMLFKTKSKYGNYIPPNLSTYKFIQDNFDLVHSHPLAAWAFGPDVTKDKQFYSPALQAMIDAGLRERRTPEQMISGEHGYFTQLGWNTYFNDIIPYAKQAGAILEQQGARFPNTRAMGDLAGQRITPSSLKTQLCNELHTVIPSWSLKLTSKSADEQRTLNELTDLMTNPKYKNLQREHSTTIKHLQEFLDAPDGYRSLNSYRTMVKQGDITSVDARAGWVDGVIPMWADRYPDIAPALHSIFVNFG